MTQPAATKHSQKMESLFTVPLLHRDRSGMRVTPHGNVVGGPRRHPALAHIDNTSAL